MAKKKTLKTLSDMPYLAEQVLANPREQEWFNRMSAKWGGQYARMLLQRKIDAARFR